MAGFLDRGSRIIDLVLTGQGKFMLAQGDLSIAYWAAFDDEVDYSPYVASSGSMTPEQVTGSIDLQIESTPVRECTTGYRLFDGRCRDTTNVNRPLFTMPQGSTILPRMRVAGGLPSDDVQLVTKQRKVADVFVQKDAAGNNLQLIGPVDRGYDRIDPQVFTLDLGYSPDGFPPEHAFEGFLVTVFTSGSDGFREIDPKHDLADQLTYNGDLKVFGRGVV